MNAPKDRAEVLVIMAGYVAEYEHAVECLAALEAAGVRLVPAEATDAMCSMLEDMIDAGADSDRAYAVMLTASPFAPEAQGDA